MRQIRAPPLPADVQQCVGFWRQALSDVTKCRGGVRRDVKRVTVRRRRARTSNSRTTPS